MDADCLHNLKALNERAGKWYSVAEKGTVDICTRKPRRLAVVALMVLPEDAECIIAEHEAVPRLCAEVEGLQSWTPTVENINALPEGIRQYIHDIETRSDPAGDIRTIAVQKENLAALEKRVVELEGALEYLCECVDAAKAEGLDAQIYSGHAAYGDGSLADLYQRRIGLGIEAARAALEVK
jgi:hypothetical protein